MVDVSVVIHESASVFHMKNRVIAQPHRMLSAFSNQNIYFEATLTGLSRWIHPLTVVVRSSFVSV